MLTVVLPQLIVARGCHIKSILHFVGGAAGDASGLLRWLIQKAFGLADIVVVPTRSFEDELERCGFVAQFSVIPHIVKVDAFSSPNRVGKGTPVVLSAKSLVKDSGYEDMLAVIQAVRKRGCEVDYWIFGEGPERECIQRIVKSSDMSGVILHGEVPHAELPQYFKKGSLFLHAAKYESFGLVLVEAMAAGLPVVAYDVGGIRDIVKDGINGFLVPHGDRNMMSDKVHYLMTNREAYKTMSDQNRLDAQVYAGSSIALEWRQLYTTICPRLGEDHHG